MRIQSLHVETPSPRPLSEYNKAIPGSYVSLAVCNDNEDTSRSKIVVLISSDSIKWRKNKVGRVENESLEAMLLEHSYQNQ